MRDSENTDPGSSDAKKTPNRQHPRKPSEISPRLQSRIAKSFPFLDENREQAIADLGGEENITALRHEQLELGLLARGVVALLIAEMQHEAQRAKNVGSTPHPSQWKCTALLPTWIATAARCFDRVGLNRAQVNITPDLRSVWTQQADQPEPDQPDQGNATHDTEAHSAAEDGQTSEDHG